jgi:hypothetical protein
MDSSHFALVSILLGEMGFKPHHCEKEDGENDDGGNKKRRKTKKEKGKEENRGGC